MAAIAASVAFQKELDALRAERRKREVECPTCTGSGYTDQYDVDAFGTCATCNGYGTIEKEKTS
jgi:DnaJ-class molecular chaperone